MARSRNGASGGSAFVQRLHARLAGRKRCVTGFATQPEPRTIGTFARGRQIIAGTFQFAGFVIEGGILGIWDLPVPDARFEHDLHGFAWLDDLAAVGDGAARKRAQGWTFDWIGRFGRGTGPGWTPDLTGRRLTRWINHANLLLAGVDRDAAARFFESMGQQTLFLSRRWKTAPHGLARLEALTGLIHAGLWLTGMEHLTTPAAEALSDEAATLIDAEGGIPGRNPEELLMVFTLLTQAAAELSEAGRSPHPDHIAAMDRIAPTLRALRHADGGLARFHGGGRGAEGRLDQALAQAGGKAVTAPGLAMGFARLAAGRTTVLVDAASPPKGAVSANAHASTLAIEVTSGRRPLIVNCGSGLSFGADWHRAGRATPSHSTLAISGFSSARLGVRAGRRMRDLFDAVPEHVWCEQETDVDGLRFLGGHNGYEATHGLIHMRALRLALDGRTLNGEDTLGAMTDVDRNRFDAAIRAGGGGGLSYEARFHLHPDVDAALDLGGKAVSMALKSGEIWIMRHDGTATLTLAPSVYLEGGRLKPRATLQIVLSGRIADYGCHIRWTFAKAQDTPAAVRDVFAMAEAEAET